VQSRSRALQVVLGQLALPQPRVSQAGEPAWVVPRQPVQPEQRQEPQALLPWALFSLLTGNTALGIGLAVLYAVITVIRQVIEPHIVGKSLGLHPILMLVALYAGLKIFGLIGVFAGPALALGVKVFFSREEQHVTQSDIKEKSFN